MVYLAVYLSFGALYACVRIGELWAAIRDHDAMFHGGEDNTFAMLWVTCGLFIGIALLWPLFMVQEFSGVSHGKEA